VGDFLWVARDRRYEYGGGGIKSPGKYLNYTAGKMNEIKEELIENITWKWNL
jgi:hypothetical protein